MKGHTERTDRCALWDSGGAHHSQRHSHTQLQLNIAKLRSWCQYDQLFQFSKQSELWTSK